MVRRVNMVCSFGIVMDAVLGNARETQKANRWLAASTGDCR
jgi:hypothetical protein